jgi:hypothetical protein
MFTFGFRADFEAWCLKPGDKILTDESFESLEKGLDCLDSLLDYGTGSDYIYVGEREP